jgi:hypothetical protein
MELIIMFKRALLTAIAVLMMLPALAMAQSSSTFPFEWNFVPVAPNPAPSFEVQLSCNGGTPLTQNFTATSAVTYNPVVLDAPDGTLCNFSLVSDLPDGWSAAVTASCSNIAPVDVAELCAFTVFPTPFTFWVNVDFEEIGEASDVEIGGDLTLTCTNVWENRGLAGIYLTTLSDTYSGYNVGELPDGLNALLPGTTYHADPLERTECSASLSGQSSAVEVTNCAPYEVLVGDPVFIDKDDLPRPGSEEVSICNIQATVFFEGIPTLSQYGMAIMALLMLGVGFFGFRRFV